MLCIWMGRPAQEEDVIAEIKYHQKPFSGPLSAAAEAGVLHQTVQRFILQHQL